MDIRPLERTIPIFLSGVPYSLYKIYQREEDAPLLLLTLPVRVIAIFQGDVDNPAPHHNIVRCPLPVRREIKK